MPELPEESKIRSSRSDDPRIDDMLDGGDIHQWSDQFGQVISYIHASLYEDYAKHDSAAISNQKRHREASWIAIVAGTITILISLSGVVLEGKSKELGIDFTQAFSHYFWSAEVGFFLTTVFAIIIAKYLNNYLEYWLVERYCAEEYRSRKFQALLKSSLFCNPEKPWIERFSVWKTEFDKEVCTAKNGIKKSVGQCIPPDSVSAPPPNTYGCNFDERYLNELVTYYQEKRLRTQIDYFDTRFDTLEKQDEGFRRILEWAFILSILLVFLKLTIDFLRLVEDQKVLYVVIILIMLILPIIVFGVRRLRSSTEIARRASLYRTNRNALVDFQNRLVMVNTSVHHNWEDTIEILWECENHLERVNREWIRIMKEAEWFL